MELKDFFDEARERLYVTWLTVTPTEGKHIDVGEEFDVQLSIRNTFSGTDGIPSFRDIELDIEGTVYAEPAAEASGLKVAERLGPGESIQRVVRFRALRADPKTEGEAHQEPIAGVKVRARLDLESMLDIETKPKVLRAQIYGKSTE